MKRFILFLALCAFLCVGLDAKPVHVKGYTKKDGTYVAPHVRSSPNKTKSDNYSTRGNVNPYTGKEGTTPVDDGVKEPAKSQSATESGTDRNGSANATKQTTVEKTYWLTTKSGVRHNSKCRYYQNSHGSPCTKDEGRACKICGG
ncbi:MAG: hypothetical protein HYV96_21125 [Opitutae bacterium]|nr:hypothetical protein [Opitutae bacterium]